MVRKQVDSFILDKRIGGGSYGEVWRGRAASSNLAFDGKSKSAFTEVALRCVRRKVEAKVARLRSEVRLLRQVSHTNILRFHGLRKTPSYFYMALEYCDGGDLAQLMRAQGPLPEADSWRFCVQITAGLLALHCESFFHGNLQPRSVLLSDSSKDPKLKLANFTFKAEPNPYMAPEVLAGEPCDGQSDMWSAGAILYEMLFGRPPFRGASRSQLLASHFSSEVSFAETRSVTGEGRAFCQSLLGRHSPERLSSSDCARHAYVKRGPRANKAGATISVVARRSRNTPSGTTGAQVVPRFGAIQLAQMWPISSARLACASIAQYYLYVFGVVRELGGLAYDPKNTGDGEADNEASNSRLLPYTSYRRGLGPGGLHMGLNDRSPVAHFVVGQLRYSHFFRIRTARLFPRVLYSI